MDSTDSLKYKDDTDRSYGVAGMALAAFILDYEKYIASVSVERRGLDAVEFSPDFYMAAAGEGISPKASWAHVIEQYQIIASMLISNVMCRSMVRNHAELGISYHDAMLDALCDYAKSVSLKLMKLKNCLTNIISISTALITTAVCTSLRSVSSMNCRQGIHYFIRTFATS